jgi:PTH1 family peptidyl-tRNA hydrolase
MRARFTAFRDRLRRVPATDETLELAAEGDASPRRPALVCGLGNTGARYGNTRHNVGAWTVNLLARRYGRQLERHGRIDGTTIDSEGGRFHVARSRSMYNDCGPPIAAEVRRLRLRPEQLLVVYDDIDLPLEAIRVRQRGSHGGNNGMRSIIAALGSSDFPRIRIGIDRPYDGGAPVRDPERVAGWVLSNPPPDERRRLDETVALVADAVELAAREGVERAMNRYNR